MTTDKIAELVAPILLALLLELARRYRKRSILAEVLIDTIEAEGNRKTKRLAQAEAEKRRIGPELDNQVRKRTAPPKESQK